jgi:exopolysaccharide biosynthesis polyprenyl glycosylphosphotransferase
MSPPELSKSTSTPALLTPRAGGRTAPAPLGTTGRGRLQHLLDGRGWALVLVLGDVIALSVALLVAVYWLQPGERGDAPVLAALPLVGLLCLAARRAYDHRTRVEPLDGLGAVLGAISVAVMVLLVAGVALDGRGADPAPYVVAWLVGAVSVAGVRSGATAVKRAARARGLVGRPTLVVGAGRVGTDVANRLADAPELGLNPVGFLDADPPAAEAVGRRQPVLGGPNDLVRVIALTGARHVVLAFSTEADRMLLPLIRQCEALGIELSIVPRLFESMNHRVAYEPVGALPVLGLRQTDPAGWEFAVKHAFDQAASFLLLVFLGPLLAAIALGVKLSSPGPVLFRQTRVGRDGQIFDLIKFRTMREDDDAGGFEPELGSAPGGVEGVDRRTPIGRLLRRTSLDELPQLVNVLRGQMSLVGPRPERPEFVELFTADLDRYADRHRVRSGITGWAQVHGLRGQTSLRDRVEYDNYYIEHWSLALDLKILVRTTVAGWRAAE